MTILNNSFSHNEMVFVFGRLHDLGLRRGVETWLGPGPGPGTILNDSFSHNERTAINGSQRQFNAQLIVHNHCLSIINNSYQETPHM